MFRVVLTRGEFNFSLLTGGGRGVRLHSSKGGCMKGFTLP